MLGLIAIRLSSGNKNMRSLIDVVHTRPLTSLVLCQALLCIVVFEQRSAAECPMGQPMDRVITISKGSIPMTDLWNMGADDFGVSGDRLVVRETCARP